MSDDSFKIRNVHKKQRYIVDDVYLDHYAKIFGPSGTAVYNSLCRRVDSQQFCFPSEKLIAKEHNMSERTVSTYIKQLTDARLIIIERRKSSGGKYMRNGYTLLDPPCWKKPEEIVAYGYRRKIKANPKENNNKNQAQSLPNKDSHVRDSQPKELEDLCKSRDDLLRGMEMFSPQNRTGIQEDVSMQERRERNRC